PARSPVRLPASGAAPVLLGSFRLDPGARRVRPRDPVPGRRRGAGRTPPRTARPRPRVPGRLPAGRRQPRADEPLGTLDAAAGRLRARTRARAGVPAGPATPPGAVVPRLRRRRAAV